MTRLQNWGRSEKVFLIYPFLPSLYLPGARSLVYWVPHSVFPIPTTPSFGAPFSWGLASKKSVVFPDHRSCFFRKLTHSLRFPSPNWFLEMTSPLRLVLRRGIPSLWPSAWVPPAQICPKYLQPYQLPICKVWAGPLWCRHCPRPGRPCLVPASTPVSLSDLPDYRFRPLEGESSS